MTAYHGCRKKFHSANCRLPHCLKAANVCPPLACHRGVIPGSVARKPEKPTSQLRVAVFVPNLCESGRQGWGRSSVGRASRSQ